MAKQEIKLIANNKKAHHDYFLEEKYEAGVELHGTEVKSLRMGKCSIKEAFVGLDGDEVYVYRMNISPYEKWIFIEDISLLIWCNMHAIQDNLTVLNTDE